jgi:hypothetical protein
MDPVWRLKPLALRLRRGDGPLSPQILQALNAHGRPLRWAITAVQGDELAVEAVVVCTSPQP